MVGLNVPKEIDRSWQNYHVVRNDYKLREAFNDTFYRGAYMTDLIKDHPEANSEEVANNLDPIN